MNVIHQALWVVRSPSGEGHHHTEPICIIILF